jgi:phage terminase large subunit-like protein
MSAGPPPRTAARRSRAAAAVARRKAHQEAHPLAYARLWHAEGWDESGKAPRQRTSQRAAVQAICGSVSMASLGGTGVGKSEAAGQLAVACMLGREHPDTQAWLRANHIDPETIPPYPGRVLVSSLTSDLSKKIMRLKVDKYLPRDPAQPAIWHNKDGDGVADVSILALRPPGDSNGAMVVFKSNDQGARAYQSDEFDVVVNDEEHDHAVFDQELARLNRRNVPGFAPWRGCWVAHFTTLENGYTWIWRDHVDEPKPGYVHRWLHAPDSPYCDMDVRNRSFAGLSAAKLALRQFGTPGSGEGRVYPMFSRDAHVIPADTPIEPGWLRFRAIDFGTRNPFCCLWLAHDPGDDVIHVYRCLYRAGYSTSENGAEIVRLSGSEVYEWTVSDHDLNSRRTLALEYDIDTVPADKAIDSGIDDVIDRLSPDANGRVHIVFHDTPEMRAVLREIDGYRYPEPTGRADGKEAPLKRDDHAMDALRYFVRFFRITTTP